MQRAKQWGPDFKVLVGLGLAYSLTQCAAPPAPVATPQKLAAMPQPVLTIQGWPDNNAPVAQVHVVTIPPNYPIEVAVSGQLKTVEEFAADTGAMAVLNGGFFDPANGQTTSFVTVNGALVADPRDNNRLMDNPDLTVYMEQILNRSEFRRYRCGDDIRYDITFHNAPLPANCKLHSALGAGPQLLPDTAQTEGFIDFADGSLMRDAIGSQQRNARSAIGMRSDGTLVWVMVSQTKPDGGMTLAELAELMTTLNVQKALNLDGGSSSSLAWSALDGLADSYYGRLDPIGQPIKRPVKSVLLLPGQDDLNTGQTR
ncbi:periplasmic protein [Leptolyngbya sp. Heron Island J]|uniref:phosphodiester glycosidase family protein n=1 Tax=Leptolyngbya sp. Heron Island J TaxID=1385935 RepID=UPI0003B9D860|nr:phosphodiester glycosidase family protein [Leptolyngbya sp. Heron Island J]ESA36729.1 periplasmic protein [Leptolyngbya sp. Heron Island J]